MVSLKYIIIDDNEKKMVCRNTAERIKNKGQSKAEEQALTSLCKE